MGVRQILGFGIQPSSYKSQLKGEATFLLLSNR